MRHKKTAKEKYIELFCRDKRIRKREVAYISREVHEVLSNIALIFKSEHYTTLSSLVDTILIQHVRTHQKLFIDLQKEYEEAHSRLPIHFKTNTDLEEDPNEAD